MNVISIRKVNFESKGFYDILIDNKSVQLIFATQKISPLGWGNKKEQLLALNRFRLKEKSTLESSQVELLVCAECGDIGCGSITMKIIPNDSHIIWRNFAFENDFDEPNLEDNELQDIGPFIFERNQYFQALTSVKI